MFRLVVFGLTALCIQPVPGAERDFNFSEAAPGEIPAGFRSAVSGEGRPSTWKIVEDEPPQTLAPTNAAPSVVTKRRVLAHFGTSLVDEHFPLLIFDTETFADFTLTTRFKTVSGAIERMAGVAFRIQDEKNYYVVRASSLGNTFRFYKFVDGVRTTPMGPEIDLPKGVWHEVAVECKGNEIRCLLNGKQAIPTITDSSFADGKIGFWTKSDSTTYFGDTRIVYTPRSSLAKTLVREAMEKHSRVLGIRIYARTDRLTELHVIASNDETDLGKPAGQYEQDAVTRDVMYYGREDGQAIVNLPLHDRNGEAVAAVRIRLKAIPGQTEQNAVARAKPIVKAMEKRVRMARDLTQ